MNKVPEHQQGSTVYCSQAQQNKRTGEFGYISALLDICDTKVAINEKNCSDDHFTVPIEEFWKDVDSYMTISPERVLDIIKLDVGMADWKYRLFSKKYKEVA